MDTVVNLITILVILMMLANVWAALESLPTVFSILSIALSVFLIGFFGYGLLSECPDEIIYRACLK
jgi:hypothetical protein